MPAAVALVVFRKVLRVNRGVIKEASPRQVSNRLPKRGYEGDTVFVNRFLVLGKARGRLARELEVRSAGRFLHL